MPKRLETFKESFLNFESVYKQPSMEEALKNIQDQVKVLESAVENANAQGDQALANDLSLRLENLKRSVPDYENAIVREREFEEFKKQKQKEDADIYGTEEREFGSIPSEAPPGNPYLAEPETLKIEDVPPPAFTTTNPESTPKGGISPGGPGRKKLRRREIGEGEKDKRYDPSLRMRPNQERTEDVAERIKPSDVSVRPDSPESIRALLVKAETNLSNLLETRSESDPSVQKLYSDIEYLNKELAKAQTDYTTLQETGYLPYGEEPKDENLQEKAKRRKEIADQYQRVFDLRSEMSQSPKSWPKYKEIDDALNFLAGKSESAANAAQTIRQALENDADNISEARSGILEENKQYQESLEQWKDLPSSERGERPTKGVTKIIENTGQAIRNWEQNPETKIWAPAEQKATAEPEQPREELSWLGYDLESEITNAVRSQQGDERWSPEKFKSVRDRYEKKIKEDERLQQRLLEKARKRKENESAKTAAGEKWEKELQSNISSLLQKAKNVISFFTKNPVLWNDSYSEPVLSTPKGSQIDSLLSLVQAMQKPAKKRDSDSLFEQDLEGVTRNTEGDLPQGLKEEPASYDEAEDFASSDLEAADYSDPEDADVEEAVDNAASGQMNIDELDMLIEDVQKAEKAIKDKTRWSPQGAPQTKGDIGSYRPSPPRADAPSISGIVDDMYSVAMETGNSRFFEQDENGEILVGENGKPVLNARGRVMAKGVWETDIADYMQYLLYNNPTIQKSLATNAFRLDKRSLDVDPERTVNMMANIVFKDLMEAIKDKRSYSVTRRWPEIEKIGMEKGVAFEEAFVKWLNSQVYGSRLRLNQGFARSFFSPDYKKWLSAKSFMEKELNSRYPVKGLKEDKKKAVWAKRRKIRDAWLKKNRFKGDKWIGVSSLEQLFEKKEQADAQSVGEFFENGQGAESEFPRGESGFDVSAPPLSEQLGSISDQDIDNALADISKSVKSKRAVQFAEFMFKHPEFLAATPQTDEDVAAYNKAKAAYRESKMFRLKFLRAMNAWDAENPKGEDEAAWQAARKKREVAVTSGLMQNWTSNNPKPNPAKRYNITVKNWNGLTNKWKEEHPNDAVGRASLEAVFNQIKNFMTATSPVEQAPEAPEGTSESEALPDTTAPAAVTQQFPFGDKSKLPKDKVDYAQMMKNLTKNRIAKIRKMIDDVRRGG